MIVCRRVLSLRISSPKVSGLCLNKVTVPVSFAALSL